MSYIEDNDVDLPTIDEQKGIVKYHSKLVGVTFEGRQDIIKMITGDEPLRVRREADNQYDPRAVAVDVQIAEVWHPIGYIAKDKNKDISETLDAGNEVNISIASITGGNDDKAYGVNIELDYAKLTAPKVAEAKEPIIERVLTPLDELQLAFDKLVNSVRDIDTKEKYTSRLLGKSTVVSVNDGHVSLPGYLSGSKFPDQFYGEFNEAEQLQFIVDKFGVDAAHVKAMWNLNREASTGYGTAIHAALENYDTYYKLGDKIKSVKVLKTKTNTGPNKAFSKNPFLKKIVEDFHEKFGGDYIRLSEQFVWLHDKKICGKIDRVKVIDAEKKIVRIQDFKTDGDIHEKKYQLVESPFYPLTQGKDAVMGKELLDLHWLQLSFYAFILKQYGYTVEGLDVYWLNPNKLCTGENAWEEFSREVINIEGVL